MRKLFGTIASRTFRSCSAVSSSNSKQLLETQVGSEAAVHLLSKARRSALAGRAAGAAHRGFDHLDEIVFLRVIQPEDRCSAPPPRRA
ncbi:MAG: hypothetical protein R3F11_27340 [Verrucomicrobiales bacterium]